MQLHRRPAWGIARSQNLACSRYTGLRRHALGVHASAASLAHLGSSFLSLDDHVVASPGPQLPGLSRKSPRPLPPPPTESSPAHVLPYLMGLMLGDWRLVCLSATSLLLVCTSKLAGLACPFFLKQAVDTLNAGPAAANALPLLPFPLLPAGTPPVVQSALFAVACFGLCDVVKHICKEAQAPIFLPVTQAVSRRVTHHAFAHVLQLDVSFHMDKRTGRLSRILDRGPRGIQQIYRAAIFIFLPTTFELVAVCTVLARTFSPLVGGLVGVTFALYTAWSITLTQMATEVRKQVIELDNQVTSKVVDALLNFETVTLFNNQRLEVGQFYNGLKAYQGATGRTEQLAAMLNAGQALILALGMAAVMFAAVLVGRSGSGATAGDLVMIQGLLLQLWAPLQFLGWVYRELKNSLVDMTELVDILRTKSSIQDGTIQLPNVPSTTAPASGTAAAAAAAQGLVLDQHLRVASPVPSTSAVSSHTDGNGSGNGNGAAQQLAERREAALSAGTSGAIAASSSSQGLEIELRDVHFGYSSNRKILHGVSLRVGRGQSVAIVGPSGSGKSTVLKLLTRQYDINSGSVLLNGVEMRDLTLDSLRAAVAVVPQDTVLFNDSILQNIRYGRPEASDAEVLEAARMARLDVAVSKMPNGFETVVGERGLKLSGGEKQRVAIARAFLRSPRLLICDEATSALDTETEAQIIESLDTLAQGRTSIFVAHRLSTVRKCDKIIVLQDGVVAEEGSHVELMEREDGLYKTMWERQVAEEGQERGGGPPIDVTKSASSDDEDKDVTLLLPGESKEGIALSGMRSVLWMADESNGKGVLVAVPKQ